MCDLCWCGEMEDIDHTLVACGRVRVVWVCGGFLSTNFALSFREFFLQVLDSYNDGKIYAFVSLAWHVWMIRNNFIWNNKR